MCSYITAKILNFLTWIEYRKCTGNVNLTFPVLFLDRSVHSTCHMTRHISCSIPAQMLYIHSTCQMTSHISFMQEMSHFPYYFCTDPAHNTCMPYIYIHIWPGTFHYAENAIFPAVFLDSCRPAHSTYIIYTSCKLLGHFLYSGNMTFGFSSACIWAAVQCLQYMTM